MLLPKCSKSDMRSWVRLGLQVGSPLLLSPLLFNTNTDLKCAYVVLLTAVYWTLELLPLPVTSLFPVFLFPLLGIMDSNKTSAIYLKDTNMLYMGSLIMALAVEESGLHKRIALKALLAAGTGMSRVMLGFMLPTAFLSMWISNAATAAMMLPIIEAVLEQLQVNKNHRSMMLLCVAYSSNVGGTGTIIGTPPNMILMEFLQPYEDHPLNFGSWILYSVPQLMFNLGLVWVVLQVYFMRSELRDSLRSNETEKDTAVRSLIRENYNSLGRMSFQEKCVLSLFSSLVVIWFFRDPGFMPGWADYLQYRNKEGTVKISSACPTIFIVALLFIIPRAPHEDMGGEALLTWDKVQQRFPWGIILLMGGGFALAEGSKVSCLSSMMDDHLKSLSSLSSSLVLLIICLLTSVVSQIASNAATTSVFLPIVLNIADTIKVNPLYLALGVTLTASNAFMLPVSTPPNAIIYTAGGIRVFDMAVVGLVLNLLCMFSTMLSLHTYGSFLFGLSEFPSWANITLDSQQGCQL